MLTPNYIVHESGNAVFTAYTYTYVIVGYAPSGITATINGTSMSLAPSTSFDLRVDSCSATSGIYLCGVPKMLMVGDSNLGSRCS